MSVADPAARIETAHVRIKIKSAQQPTYWYANLVGKVIEAERTITTYVDKPDRYVKYTLFPDRHKHIVSSDVEEVNTPRLVRELNLTHGKRKPTTAQRRKRERQNKRKGRK